VTQDVRSDPGGLVPGEQLAGYQIQEQIGRGGMAVVYRALDLRLGRIVALKVLAPHLGEDEAFRQRFIRESRAAAGVDHPHIIPVFEAGEAGGVLFIAMRYVGHGDVRSLIDAEGRLTPARAAAIVAQAASALDAAHTHGLVHRDVKPGNILLALASDDSDHVYLSDFGLSKHSVNPSTLTSTGQFLGTLDYVSPEQIQGHPVDGRADQYALACTAVEMLTGAPPFHNDDSMAVMWAQLESEPPSVTQRRPDLSPAVDEVIAAAMSKSPASRYQTCRDFALAFGAACEQSPMPRTAPAEIRAPWPDPRPAPYAQPAPNTQQSADARDRPRALQRQDDHQPADHRAGFDRAGPERAARAVPVTRWDGPVPGQIDPVSYAARAEDRPPRSPGTPTGFAERASARPSRHADNVPGTRPPQAGQPSPGRGRPRTHRARNTALTVLVVLVGLAGIAGIAYKLAHRQDGAAPPPAASHTGPAASQRPPAQIVREYFTAINRHHYQAAWHLSNEQEPLATFEAGYAGTRHDTIKIISPTVGDVVTARLIAVQTDGAVKTYEGTYTVTDGVISSTDVHQVSGPVTS
jgi:serine/threonine protein kinase